MAESRWHTATKASRCRLAGSWADPASTSDNVGPVLSARFISGVLLRRLLLEGGASTPPVVHTVTALGTQFGPAYIRLHYLPAIATSLDTHAKRPTARTATIVPNVLVLVEKLVLQLPATAVTDVLDNVLARPLLALLMPLPPQPKLDEQGRAAICRGTLEVLRYITHTVPRPVFEKKARVAERDSSSSVRAPATRTGWLTEGPRRCARFRPTEPMAGLQVLPLLQAFFIRFNDMFDLPADRGTGPDGDDEPPALRESVTPEEKVDRTRAEPATAQYQVPLLADVRVP